MKNRNLFTLIPKVDELLDKESTKKLLEHIPRKIVLDSIRLEIDKIREKIKQGNTTEEEVLECINNLDLSIEKTARNKNDYKLRRVVNATGVVIHTNLEDY